MTKYLFLAAAVAALIGGAVLAVKLVTGIIGGLFNAVLGIAVVIALVAIVAWMFWYAGKNR